MNNILKLMLKRPKVFKGDLERMKILFLWSMLKSLPIKNY